MSTSFTATTIIEHYRSSRGWPRAVAANKLVQAGAQFVEAAIQAHPAGPVHGITTIAKDDITYAVIIGDVDDMTNRRTIWQRCVRFGNKDQNHAGGPAFVAAAQLQDTVARAVLALLTRDEAQAS